jgi:two-component system LytT family response regulator
MLRDNFSNVEVMSAFSNVNDAILFVENHNTDLVFLDINMPGKDGFDFLKYFPERNFEVVFVTAYDNFAIKAIKESALDYLLKPIILEDLKTAVNKTIQKINKKNNKFEEQKIELSYSGGKTFVLPKEIIYIQGIDNISKVYLENGKTILLSKSLKHFENILDNTFFRSHKSWIVNLIHINELDTSKTNLLLSNNGIKIPISIRNINKFKKRINK